MAFECTNCRIEQSTTDPEEHPSVHRQGHSKAEGYEKDLGRVCIQGGFRFVCWSGVDDLRAAQGEKKEEERPGEFLDDLGVSITERWKR